ncbi:hypothetical protein [Burkholderia sp. 567]|uniref:hypothetical protein n=1 Tax=Burkholderia sp. 567 TaxID=3156413 RepID=UPI00339AD172
MRSRIRASSWKWPEAAGRHPQHLAERRTSRLRVRAAGKLGCQSNFSRSHEHATHRSTCNRHSNDAAVPARYLTRLGNQSHAKTYAHIKQAHPNSSRGRTMGKKSRLKKERAHTEFTVDLHVAGAELLDGLTTPKTFSGTIAEFCRSLSDQEAFYIACEPEPWSRLGCCDTNVEKYIASTGRGEAMFGFRIWSKGANYVEAESHTIWRDGDIRRDVSFSNEGEDHILFVPIRSTFAGTFDDIPKKIRKAFGKRNNDYLQVIEKYESRINRRQMPRDVAWETMLTYEQWLTGKRYRPIISHSLS